MVEFSDLPDDIVSDVFRRLSDVEDCVRFPSVCKSWSSVASNDENVRSKPFSPWLMLTSLHNDSPDGEEGGVRVCYTFPGNKLFRLRLPELQGRKGWGTPHGWLLTLGLDVELYLFHPFTRAKISLPSPHKFTDIRCQYLNSHHLCETFIARVAISSNPSESSPSQPVVVMVVYGGGRQVSFASPGDKLWMCVKFAPAAPMDDVIFFNGSFYCLNGDGDIYVCDISNPLEPSTRLIAPRPKKLKRRTDHDSNFYLVGFSGHLYIIRRKWRPREERGLDPGDISTLRQQTLDFYAYEFDLHAGEWRDSAVKDFNGHAILVGNSTSCAISTVDHPELKPDCIYFTDDQVQFYKSKLGCYNDMGVYDFKNKVMMEPFYVVTESQWGSKISRPFFFLPTLK